VQRRSALESGPSRSSGLTNPDRSVKERPWVWQAHYAIDPVGVGIPFVIIAQSRDRSGRQPPTRFRPLVDHGTRDASSVISGTPASALLTGHPALAALACSANAA
jgi:hypothetical protein